MIEDFQSCGDDHSRFYALTGGSLHLRSGIIQKLNMSAGTQSPVSVLKAVKSAKEYEYRNSNLLKVQRNMSIDTQSLVPMLKAVKSVEEDEYQYSKSSIRTQSY